MSCRRPPPAGHMFVRVAAVALLIAFPEGSWEALLLWWNDCRLRSNKKMAKLSFCRY